jgi:hypothetical protein
MLIAGSSGQLIGSAITNLQVSWTKDSYGDARLRGGTPRMSRSWASPSEVDHDSAIAQQLELMRDFVSGKIAGPDFAKAWLSARRRVLDAGERVRERFERILTDVFYLLDDYVIDPALRDSGDMTDGELAARVRAAINDLDSLDVSGRSGGSPGARD